MNINERLKELKKAIMLHFFERYCECGNSIIHYNTVYEALSKLALEKYGVEISKPYFTRNIHYIKDIKVNWKSANKRMIQGIRFNKRGRKLFKDSNLSNLGLKGITSAQACIELSCKPGRLDLIKLYGTLPLYIQKDIDFKRLMKVYKDIETFLHRENIIREPQVKQGTALYICSEYSQKLCAKFTGTSAMSIRGLYRILSIVDNPLPEAE